MRTKRDYYSTLKISPKASIEEIKASFRRLARQYHPDLNPNNPEASEYFKEISEAYETLSDPIKRRRYDRDRNLTSKNYSSTDSNIRTQAPEPIKEPHNAKYFYRRGVAHSKAKRYQEAIAAYSKAIALDPKFIDAYLKRAEMRQEMGDYQGILDDCYWIIKIDPLFTKAYYYQGRARYSLGYVQAAIDSFSEAIRQDKDYAQAYFHRGIAYGDLQSKSLAIKDLRFAAELFRFEGNHNACHLASKKINQLNRVNLNIWGYIKSFFARNSFVKILGIFLIGGIQIILLFFLFSFLISLFL